MDQEFWTSCYKKGNTGWDVGYVSPPIKEYFDQLNNKDDLILIPGGGNSYEAEYLITSGFQNTWVIDIALPPLQNLMNRCPTFPRKQLIHGNFFNLDAQFDIIVEQTFFCAIDPNLRTSYVEKCHELLGQGGRIIGLLFGIPLNEDHPPYGGRKEEYVKLFRPFFEIKVMETAYNSIQPRAGNELFIHLVKR